MTILTGQQIAGEGLTGWAFFYNSLETRIATPNFAAGLALVAAIGGAAEQADHHPDVDLRYSYVDIRLTSHDEHGVTARDVRMARTITALAADDGLQPASDAVSRLDLALDTPDRTRVLPFWEAVLGLVPADEADVGLDLIDPADRLPDLWFQPSGDQEPRQRWHHDVWIDPAEVQPRLDAAVAAGGRVVSDEHAPAYWVLADPDGNNVCLCTWEGRD
ncbi:4a-hydroxytetrahydrobiopterin dehydratase [Cryptosporangium phraense]|uniref:Putative pterin-4-alpha-carbinolamine dehydratase n=1 Tax=Cryptosporangium phraense TaxID=2593070 RepID=A0A545ARL4_9ACTN|nr:4a-hydroxytetrahydrobiopterin dehydratase [Cryptosporangium phraense]TQS43984.1 4a-hydroxytetrahydrobiopterin dehydratase [Cryptosporangium phraense]